MSSIPFPDLSANLPVALLPVRIETRFIRDALCIRIYPDEIHADAHEPGLTTEELAAGKLYWQTKPESDAWRSMLVRYPSTRAAWIVRATAPGKPAPASRPASWSQPVLARLLPDRWIVRAYRQDRVVLEGVSLPVQTPLPLSFAPNAKTRPDMPADAGSAWMVDFETALSTGMAIRIPLDRIVPREREFDLLMVLGVRSEKDPGGGAAAIEQLFDAHHYTRGLAFLAPGTPTNNTQSEPSPWPPNDENGERSFALERLEPAKAADSGAARMAAALGTSGTIFERVELAGALPDDAAKALNRALFPATLGYFLEQLMHPEVSAAQVDAVQAHFVTHLRAAGHVPAFRVGSVPYGVLPAGSISSAAGAGADWLRVLLSAWKQQIPQLARVGRTADAAEDLVSVLQVLPHSESLELREALGPEAQREMFSAVGLANNKWFDFHKSIAAAVLSKIGKPDWKPLAAELSFADDTAPFHGDLVCSVPGKEPLEPNYIRWIRTATIDDLRRNKPPFPNGTPDSLLYRLLVLAAVQEYSRAARSVKGEPARRRDVEFIKPGQPDGSFWKQFADRLPSGETVGQRIQKDKTSATASLREFLGALGKLETQPPEVLDYLLRNALDACSHRLDSWITSLFAAQLQAMRAKQPKGVHIGAFGWVENLRAAPAANASQGFVHEPSLAHAAAAAIMRSAYLAQEPGERQRYATDLSPQRVTRVIEMLARVRAGQPLAEVLGQDFERSLRDAGLAHLVAHFRRLVSGRASAIVDGLRLRDAWAAKQISLGAPPFPQDGAKRREVESLLARLDERIDAAADLLTSESVYQTVRGNQNAAAAALDALAGEGLPPECEIVRPPLGGTTLSHRVVFVLGDMPAVWPAIPATPRSMAEDRLDKWVGSLLGPPEKLRWKSQNREVTAADLKLRPVDLLTLAGSPELNSWVEQAGGPVLERPQELHWLAVLRNCLASSRPLSSADLALPDDSPGAANAPANNGAARVAAALHAVNVLFGQIRAIVPEPLPAAVRREAWLYGFPTDLPDSELAFELERRIAAAQQASVPSAQMQALFGDPFVFLPAIPQPPIAKSPSMASVDEIRKWWQTAAFTRGRMTQWNRLRTLLTAAGKPAPSRRVTQLPALPSRPWAALRFAEKDRPPAGLVSIAFEYPGEKPPAGDWAGVQIDEWTETIPSRNVQTGIAFHYDDPGAEAPQAILLAVPPPRVQRWTADALFDVCRETLDLAKVRLVDAPLLGQLAQLLPALYVATNTADEQPGTKFDRREKTR